jgi:hypothetical protein
VRRARVGARRSAWRALGAAAVLGVTLAACASSGERKPGELRVMTEEYTFRISVDPSPPPSLEPTYWTVVVQDRKSGAPVEGGEGRIFATNSDRKTVANGLAATDKVGTYRTNLLFVTAGTWAMGLQFRRDSTQALVRTEDWTWQVVAANEPGEFGTPPESEGSVRRDLPPDTTGGSAPVAPASTDSTGR